MAFWNLNTLQLDEFRPGIFSKAQSGDDLIMVVMEIGADKEDKGHSHKYDQCGVVIDGTIEMYVGDERKILSSHESYFIPSGIRHGWKTFDRPVKLLDVSIKDS